MRRMITLNKTEPGDIIRFIPGHTRSYDYSNHSWYDNDPCVFLVLSLDVNHDLAGEGKNDICVWPVRAVGDLGVSGNPALRLIDRHNWLCEYLGNIGIHLSEILKIQSKALPFGTKVAP